MSPKVAPKDETRATRIGGYTAPPEKTLKKEGAGKKNESPDKKLIRKIPKSPREEASLK